MVAAPELGHGEAAVEDERRVLLSGVSWSAYVALRDSVESGGVHMTYLEGQLEIMTAGRRHEVAKKQIARLLELFCLERDIPLYGYGSMTLRQREKRRGLEADECYCRDGDRETPDLAIEVVMTRPLVNKLEVYRGLGVREVWVFEASVISVHVLREAGYELVAASVVLPEAPLERLAHHAQELDQHEALKAFRAELLPRDN